jgi:uncharacterized membrane-anchored protein
MQQFKEKTQKHMAALEAWLAPIFAKAPHLPSSAHETLVMIAPWAALIGGILGIFGILSAGMIWSVFSFSLFAYGLMQISMLAGLVAGLVAAILELMAFQPLTNRQKKGWNFLFYGIVLFALSAVVDLFFGYGGGAFGQLLGCYSWNY